MSISGDVDELKGLQQEIKKTRGELKKLRDLEKKSQLKIINFLKEKDQPGVNYKGDEIKLDTKFSKKPKKQVIEDSIDILEKYGINDAQKLLDELALARKGDDDEIDILKINPIGKKKRNKKEAKPKKKKTTK